MSKYVVEKVACLRIMLICSLGLSAAFEAFSHFSF